MLDISAFCNSVQGEPVGVLGLGISGMATLRCLLNHSVSVIAWDDSEEKRKKAQELGAEASQDFSSCSLLVVSPGIPYAYNPHELVKNAQDQGVEIIGDIEILHRSNLQIQTIGVTGTNGKSTTTALLDHVLRTCGRHSYMGGNIGTPVADLDIPKDNGEDTVVVLEISSFQMDLCPNFVPDISILLNITPDHLDRHGSMEAYAESKARMLQGKGYAVIGCDDSYTQEIYKNVSVQGIRKPYKVSVKGECSAGQGVHIKDGQLIDAMGESAQDIGNVTKIATLPGAHNQQNIVAAYCALRCIGLESAEIFGAMQTYPGLPHRQFLTHTLNGISYINDSKATNAEATAKALACYNNIYWIVGGRQKAGGLDGLEIFLNKVKHAYLIGESSQAFQEWFEQFEAPYSHCETLDKAVLQAHSDAQNSRGEPGGAGTILLSPACASWDQFGSFEERGNVFSDLVRNLPQDEAA